METRFEQFKKEILTRARQADACREQYSRAYGSQSFAELMEVIRDNFWWAVNHAVVDGDIIDRYRAEFSEGNIWHNENVTDGYLLASGSSTVRAYGSSTVRAYDSSTVEAYDSSTVRAYGSSTVEAYGSSTVEAYDSSTVRAYDSSTVEAYDSSTVRAYGSSTVEAYGSSTVTAYDSSYVHSYSAIECKLSDKAIVRVGEDVIRYCSDELRFNKVTPVGDEQ